MSVDDVKAVKGTQSIHSAVPSDTEGNLRVRLLSCFCPACLVGESGVCESQEFVLNWKFANLLKGSENCHFPSSSKPKTNNARRRTRKRSFSKQPLDSTAIGADIRDYSSVEEDNIPLERENFFSYVYSQLSVCNSVESIKEVVSQLYPFFENFQLPIVSPKSLLSVGGCIDKFAKELIPEGFGCGLLFPVLVKSDGNCVPRSLSLAVFGNEDLHLEVRCRIVFEIASNIDLYVNVFDDLTSSVLHETSNKMCGSVRETFLQELLEIKSLGTFMGLWQLMAASNIFSCKIVSVYPSKGIACHRKVFNRVLEPKNGASGSTITVLWSSTRQWPEGYWTANHVVPLVPISDEVIVEAE